MREPKTFLLSYPRSGNTWLRYAVEFLTSKPTTSYASDSTAMNNSLTKGISRVDFTDNPVLHKRHGHMPEETEGNDFDSHVDRLILLVRDYKECIVRHKESSDTLKLQEECRGVHGSGTDYMYVLKVYDSWVNGDKLLVYYEDLIQDTSKVLYDVASFMDVDSNTVTRFVSNLPTHRKRSLELYDRHQRSWSKGSIGYHKNQIPVDKLGDWDSFLEDSFPRLFKQYLQRYKENI